MRISAIVFICRIYYLTDPFSVWNSTNSFRMNNVAKRRIRLDDGEKSKIKISSVILCCLKCKYKISSDQQVVVW